MKEKKIVPYYPLPYRPGTGNKVIRKYEEDFVDKAGNTAIITYVDYTDKKGRLVEKFVLHVKWTCDPFAYTKELYKK